jgi:hypothetical protein
MKPSSVRSYGHGASRPGDSVRQNGVWLFPLTYGIHLLEEYWVGEGFPAWAQRLWGTSLSTGEFLVWNLFGLTLMCVGALLVTRFTPLRWIEIALSVAVFGNAAGHVLASLMTVTYSPGVITGLLLWMPLVWVRLRDALTACSRTGRRAGILLGASVVLAQIAVLAACGLVPE